MNRAVATESECQTGWKRVFPSVYAHGGCIPDIEGKRWRQKNQVVAPAKKKSALVISALQEQGGQ
ncbi:hypothetical protein RA28_18320 [Ruegeria sp. ANG-S4]|nr:hypothetical protein RA28_18320 [Ruegeria sp. ANG-S4]